MVRKTKANILYLLYFDQKQKKKKKKKKKKKNQLILIAFDLNLQWCAEVDSLG